MGLHSFSLDPRAILGVGPDASLEEIREAYRVKSKKHHPDAGGDEWAFRMVVRAYEVLKTTAAVPAARPWERRRSDGADFPGRGRVEEWAWTGNTRFARPGGPVTASGDAGAADGRGTGAPPERNGSEPAGPVPTPAERPGLDRNRIRTVDVELIWTRFETDGPAPLPSTREADDATLSVCMVVAWPPADLVDRVTEFPGAAESLRTLIDLFERLRGQGRVVAARARIEDGRFVGWLSYPDVLAAQDAILDLRDTLRDRELAVKLQTRDERVPFDWYSALPEPLMAVARSQ
jgi:hypothetical protein